MKCLDYKQLEGTRLVLPEVEGVTLRIAAGPLDGAHNFTMRVFTVDPGGHTPLHAHEFEHEIFFHQGTGELFYENEILPVGPGTVAFIPPNTEHQFRNTGNHDLVFVCVVPKGI